MTTLPGSQEVPVLITGAAGRIGRMIRPLLVDAGWDLTCVDVSPGGDEAVQELDVLDHEGLDAATAGCGAVVHLAGIAREAPLPDILRANVEGTQAVLDAALRRGIRRVVLASSNHAVGFCARPESGSLPVDVPVRPDTFYGMSKVAVEALGQLYSDRFGLEVVSLRIGTCLPEPTAVRELSTWLSPGDAARLVAAALTGPVMGHVIAYGTSANTRGWWDLSSARELGYDPQDDSETFADAVPPEPAPRVPRTGTPVPPAPERVGGLFTLMPLGGLSSGFAQHRPVEPNTDSEEPSSN